eukprot:7619479-Pyramimonas_sp.AAC.1
MSSPTSVLGGGWLTTARISSPTSVRSCIFGCDGSRDEISHYWECRSLAWGIAMAKTGGRIPLHGD